MNPKIIGEISRTGNVVSDAIYQLELLTLVPIFIASLPSEVIRKYPVIGPIFEDLFNLEKILRDRFQQHPNSRNNQENRRIVDEDPLFEDYKDKISVLVGFLRFHPAIVKELKKKYLPKTSNITSKGFCKMMGRYEKIILTKLNTTNEEKEIFKEQKNDLELKAKKLRTDEKNLEKKLSMERKKRRFENSTLDLDLNRLRDERSGFMREFKFGKDRYDQQLKTKEKAITTHFEKVRSGLLEDIKKTKKKLEELRKDNHRNERIERNEMVSKESQAKSSINNYDDYMIESTEEIAHFKTSFRNNNERINELGNGIKELRNDKSFWEKKKKKERKEFLTHIRKIQAVAAAKISMVETWRRYREKYFPKKKSRGGKKRRKKPKKKGKKKGKKIKK